MDRSTQANTANDTEALQRDDVVCRISTSAELASVSSYPKPLEQIGFTGVVLPEGVNGDISPIEQLGIRVYQDDGDRSFLDLASFSAQSDVSARAVWTELERAPISTFGVDLTSGDRWHEATTLLQMSISPVPIVPVNEALLYSSQFREQRELLRSAVFWRKRFEIARHQTNLIHAGEDGLLIFSVDSWLVCINQNTEEAGIDLGNHGSMWLMLGTQRDVHLHGSMLILPAYSAAVVANELAR